MPLRNGAVGRSPGGCRSGARRALAAAVAAAAGLNGCSLRRSQPITPDPGRIAEAQARLARAFAESNLDSALVLIAPGAQLRHRGRAIDLAETLRRERSVLPPDAHPDLVVTPGRFTWCLEGAAEMDGRAGMAVYTPGEAPRRLRVRYDVRWVSDSTGSARVAAIAMVPANRPGRTTIADCRADARAVLARRDVAVTVLPGAIGNVRTKDQLHRAFAGYGLTPAVGSDEAGFGSNRTTPAPVWLTVRVRPRSGVWLELVVSGASTVRASAYDPDIDALLGMRVRTTAVGGIASATWRAFRAGAGPVLVRERWEALEYVVDVDVPPDEPPPPRAVTTWSARRLGLLTQAAATVPLTGTLFIELRSQLVALRPTLTPRVGSYPPWRVSGSGATVGAALGLAF
jgi:hypothetical protein